MKIWELFQKDITRVIQGVIKVEQQQDKSIWQELEEYVVTRELQKHFNDFYTAYNKSLTREVDDMGVWISGFFGSGKSHFLKLLSYLLANREVKGRKAVDFFESKIKDPLLLGEMRRAAQPETDVILFNIDSKSDADSKTKKDAIVKVFLKVFNDWQGFCGVIPWLAELERQLTKRGVYEAFQAAFAELTGDSWVNLRSNAYFDRDAIVAALVKAAGMTPESAAQWFDNAENNFSLSIESFAQLVQEYCRTRHRRVIFMVDEMGQYIGENSDLMLNLQTLTEDLGTYLRGKAWVIVTSQEDIDGLTGNRVKSDNFSKGVGRFATRLSLSGSNTDEVIKCRILEKNKVAQETLRLIYHEKNAILRNLICFSPGIAEMKFYQDEQDYIRTYPFVPYQFNLLQKVFENIRKVGMTGKNLSQGERSMLSAFQKAAITCGERDDNILTPFDAFFQTVESFLDTYIKRVFDKAADNSRLEPFDLRVLRVLFMIKHVKEMPANLENLTTLLVGELDADKIELRRQISAALNRLQVETLIQQNGDEYCFLTDDEQEINREIKGVAVEEREIIEHAGRYIFDGIYGIPRYTYSKLFNYQFNRKIDAVIFGPQVHDLTIQILTPYGSEYSEPPETLKFQTFDSGALVVRLPEENRALEELKEVLKLEKYLNRKNSLANPENVQKILDDKGREIGKRRQRITQLIEQAVAEAELFAIGEQLEVKTVAAKERLNQGLTVLVQNVYRKLDLIRQPVRDEREVVSLLRADDVQAPLLADGDNRQAIAEVREFIRLRDEQNIRTTLKSLQDRFTAKPYGWRPLDVSGVTATLWAAGEIKLQAGGENLDAKDKNSPNYLVKATEAEKTVVLLRKRTDPASLNSARTVARVVFNLPYLSPDEDGAFAELQTAIREEVETLRDYLGRYELHSYPGKAVVSRGLRLLKAALSCKDSISFFRELQSQKDELLDWADEAAAVKGFFQNQVAKYDEARRRLEYYQHNMNYVDLAALQDDLEQLEQIMDASEPYGMIKELPYLLKNLDDVFQEPLLQRKADTRTYIEAQKAILDAEGRRLNDVIIVNAISQEFAKLAAMLEAATDFARTDALRTLCDQVAKELWVKVDNFVPPAPPTPESAPANDAIKPEAPATPPPIVKKPVVVQVYVKEISPTNVLLQNEADVDHYLSELRRKLLGMIGAERKVRLL
jgi:hypothetical protein